MSVLVVMDVDSTLIQQEVIELLAEEAGVLEQVERITESAMTGKIDFEQSLKDRVSLLRGLPESAIAAVQARIELTPGATELIQLVHDLGGKVGAVSGGFSKVLDPLAKEIGLDYWLANELEISSGFISGKVLGNVIDAKAKEQALHSWAANFGVELSRTVAIGDGANDVLMLKAAGYAIAFRPKQILREYADLVIEQNTLLEAIEPIRLRAS